MLPADTIRRCVRRTGRTPDELAALLVAEVRVHIPPMLHRDLLRARPDGFDRLLRRKAAEKRWYRRKRLAS